MKLREAWGQFDAWQKLVIASFILSVWPLALGVFAFVAYVTDDIPNGLVYYVNPIRTRVFRGVDAPDIEVRFRGQEITEDITTVQIAVWNNGSTPIRRADILEDIRVRLEPSASILDATIQEANRTATRSQVEKSIDDNGSESVLVSWQILEGRDAVLVQLTYAGPPSVQVGLGGAVVGQASIPRLSPSFARTRDAVIHPRPAIFLAIFPMLAGGFALYAGVMFFRESSGWEAVIGSAFFLCLGVALLFGGVQTIRTAMVAPDVQFWSVTPD